MSKHEKIIKASDVMQALETLAPPELAAEWDSIGLSIGHPDQTVQKVLLALDATYEAASQAASQNCQMLITHHPLFFEPIQSIREDICEQEVAICLIRSGICLASAHTNLDAAPGGVADSLCDALELAAEDRQSIGMYARAGLLPRPMALSELRRFVTEKLGSSGCRLNTDMNHEVERVGIFPGSFSADEIDSLMTMNLQCVITGEIKHHVGLMLAARGISVIDAGHDVTERVVLLPLAEKLSKMLPQISFAVMDGLDYNRVAF